jgi:hypothetical protein
MFHIMIVNSDGWSVLLKKKKKNFLNVFKNNLLITQ